MAPANRVISFPAGATAEVVVAAPDLDGEELLRRLDLPSPRGTVVLNGSTADLPPDLVEPLGEVIGAVARLAVARGLTVLTGATDAGIFSILGAAMDGRSAPLVGVAPAGLVSPPGESAEPQETQHRERLEPHHSHFVLVDGDEWGDETADLLALAAALGARAPSAALLCGGGAGAQAEAVGHCRAGRPILVIAGSGRFADDVAAAVSRHAGAGGSADPAATEIAEHGQVRVCRLVDGPQAIVDALVAALGAGA